jgi:hypothetical protein
MDRAKKAVTCFIVKVCPKLVRDAAEIIEEIL